MRAGGVVLLATLFLLSGCAGFGANGNGGDRTVNPMLNETPTPTRELPPGIRGGETDAWRLAKAHQQTIAATSRTVIWRKTIATPSGAVPTNRTLIVRANGSLRYVRSTSNGGSASDGVRVRSYWTNGTRTVERIVTTNGSDRYDAYPGAPTGDFQAETTGWSRVYGALSMVDVTIARTTGTSAGRRYILRGEAERGLEGRVRNVSLRLVVTPEGVVESFQLRYTTLRRGQRVQVTVRFRITAIGKTVAARPDWFSRAMNESRKRGDQDRV